MNKENYGEVYISFKISAEANKFLTESAEKSGRSKKKEASLRLESNLALIEAISTMENFTVRPNKNRSCKDVSCIE